jgi:hypothetical protein
MDNTQWIEKNLAKDLPGTLKVELYWVSDIELVKSLRQLDSFFYLSAIFTQMARIWQSFEP